MNVTELMAQVRSEMTGDLKKDMQHLSDIADDLRKEPNADELVAAVAEYAFELMPEGTREKMQDMTFVGDRRMDQAFAAALKLVNAKQYADAEIILAAISDKIAAYYEGDDVKYFSFRNPFEYHMYRQFYPVDKVFERAPFDFAQYLELYGYVLLENGKTRAAEPVLDRAVKFNPVSADVRFERAELYKFTDNMPKLLDECRETLMVCTTPDRIARALTNTGFYCYKMNDFFNAAVFYFESIRFRPSKAVEFELQDVVKRMNSYGQKFTPPTNGQIIDAYEKYALTKQPSTELVNLALTLAQSAHDQQRKELEGLFLRTAYDLTNDAKMKEQLDALAAEVQAEAADQ